MVELVAKAVPPVAVEYQLTCNPAFIVTLNGAKASPWQAVGLLGLPGAATGGQLQLGAVTLICEVQLADEVLEIITLVPAGTWLTSQVNPLPDTVPAVAVTVAPFVLITTLYVCKSGAQVTSPGANMGSAFTVMVKFCKAPVQVPICGVTERIDVVLKSRPEAEVKLIFPVPVVVASPIAVLLLVQLNTAPIVPLKLTATGCPEHTATLAGAVMVGVALMVRVTGVLVVLVHPVAGSRVSA